MPRIRVQPYGASNSARDVARTLTAMGSHGRVLRLLNEDRSRFRARSSDLIINWGSSSNRFPTARYLNKPTSVALAANKLKTFQTLERADVKVPDWTTSSETAKQWIRDGNVVYARTVLSGNSGNGIVIMDSLDAFTSAPLYTKQFICNQEYRIHVSSQGIFDIQQKLRRRLTDEEREQGIRRDNLVRNHSNGWVFCRDGVEAPQVVKDECTKAMTALGLDFCGVDVGYDSDTNGVAIYEVNTACGLEGTTLTNYVNMLSGLITSRR